MYGNCEISNSLYTSNKMRTFDHYGYSKRLSRIFTDVELNFDSMEEELTCPVCLELYADPLMLPCSHSLCKKCLQDIANSKGKTQAIECPMGCKATKLSVAELAVLPRNLALENIVIRYSEERSKSIRKSLSLESPVSELLMSPASDSTELPEFPPVSSTMCELCEVASPVKAAWYCLQCEVSYCHACFAKFHPSRGSLARHKVRQPVSNEEEHRPSYCVDHDKEVASIFCDPCKMLVCSLCVCDGDGKHSGHKILAMDTAAKRIQDSVRSTQKKGEELLEQMSQQQMKLLALKEEIQAQSKDSCDAIDAQFERYITDLTRTLTAEKLTAASNLSSSSSKLLQNISLVIETNIACQKELTTLSSACGSLPGLSTRCVLDRAREMDPLASQIAKVNKSCQSLFTQYQELLDKKKNLSKLNQAELHGFREQANRRMGALAAHPAIVCPNIVPHVLSPTCPKSDQTSPTRIQNKFLITWGFSSTSFSAEPLVKASASWTVVIERNTGHRGVWNTGYLFGVGISADPIPHRALVGVHEQSCGVICNGGSLFFSQDSVEEHLMTLRGLPVSITVSVFAGIQGYVLFVYKISLSDRNCLLEGKTLVKDDCGKLKNNLIPVFTVSQKVRLIFPNLPCHK